MFPTSHMFFETYAEMLASARLISAHKQTPDISTLMAENTSPRCDRGRIGNSRKWKSGRGCSRATYYFFVPATSSTAPTTHTKPAATGGIFSLCWVVIPTWRIPDLHSVGALLFGSGTMNAAIPSTRTMIPIKVIVRIWSPSANPNNVEIRPAHLPLYRYRRNC